jgi:hypothetical protein
VLPFNDAPLFLVVSPRIKSNANAINGAAGRGHQPLCKQRYLKELLSGPHAVRRLSGFFAEQICSAPVWSL